MPKPDKIPFLFKIWPLRRIERLPTVRKQTTSDKIPIPEASKLMTKSTPEKIPATFHSVLAPEEKDPEIAILKRDIEELKTQITAMKIAAIPMEDRITILESSIQTLKKQIEPLLVILEAVNTIKAEMKNGFSATFNQLQSLTA
ncbi:hypothetical protein OUZ56_024432 [Daphnia magna]|uniref:Uncharacterized protein n=1 Tax=Daphnia magna TaxID=35525 RepID=A0ABR0B0U3_9CRUS|nr:hypothetical protein OUZ56_024432 [Daphnia magna]